MSTFILVLLCIFCLYAGPSDRALSPLPVFWLHPESSGAPQDDLRALPFLVAKARQTTRLVKQSVALALLGIAAGVAASLTGAVPLWLSVSAWGSPRYTGTGISVGATGGSVSLTAAVMSLPRLCGNSYQFCH